MYLLTEKEFLHKDLAPPAQKRCRAGQKCKAPQHGREVRVYIRVPFGKQHPAERCRQPQHPKAAKAPWLPEFSLHKRPHKGSARQHGPQCQHRHYCHASRAKLQLRLGGKGILLQHLPGPKLCRKGAGGIAFHRSAACAGQRNAAHLPQSPGKAAVINRALPQSHGKGGEHRKNPIL